MRAVATCIESAGFVKKGRATKEKDKGIAMTYLVCICALVKLFSIVLWIVRPEGILLMNKQEAMYP